MKKLAVLALLAILVPQIAMAAWWNPLSWGIFHRSERATEVLKINAEKKSEKKAEQKVENKVEKPATTVKIDDQKLPPTVKPTASILSGLAPLTVNFKVPTIKGYNYDGVYYTIVFGDGDAAGFEKCDSACPSELTKSHMYLSTGFYTAVVTVRTQCGSWECLGPGKEVARFEIQVK